MRYELNAIIWGAILIATVTVEAQNVQNQLTPKYIPQPTFTPTITPTPTSVTASIDDPNSADSLHQNMQSVNDEVKILIQTPKPVLKYSPNLESTVNTSSVVLIQISRINGNALIDGIISQTTNVGGNGWGSSPIDVYVDYGSAIVVNGWKAWGASDYGFYCGNYISIEGSNNASNWTMLDGIGTNSTCGSYIIGDISKQKIRMRQKLY